MKKRIIVSILTVIMFMTMLQTAALAADEDGTEAVASTTPQAAIYLDQQHGADSNDGLTKESAVQSIVKANELAESNHTNDIYLTSSYKITGAEVWDLGGKTIHRYGLGVYMIELVNASASLTLSNVVIDGAEYTVEATHAAETYSIIKAANGGTIVLKSGAVLQNNKATQFGSGILANNGVNITMEDGAIIRNNTNRNYELGGGILIGNGSTFTMNGGEISGNTANGGGGVAIIGSSMVMNSGTISNNSTYRTSGQGSYGAGVYVADYANASSGGNTLFTPAPASFEMNGGSISDNTALDYGGGILTFPQQGQQITININNGNISGNQVTEGSGGAVAAFFGVTELNVKGGTLSGNSAQNYGGGVFLYDATNVTISGGTISENKASQGGGVYLWPTSAVKQTNGSIENNVANVGGGVCGGTYTMTGGVIKDNNNSLTNEARLSARGDGVYVGTAFNLGNDAVISTNNDVYLVKGSSTPKEGRYINVISPYTGASTAKPIQIHSEDTTIEEANIIGTQLVHYTADADGETAATKADADSIFIPSWKMPEGLVIGQSKETGKTDWMTYVPAVKIQYQWVSTDNPTDVTPPANDCIRNGTAYTAKVQQDTNQGYVFDGWYTDEQCTLPYTDGTVLDTDTTLYGKWTVARVCVHYEWVSTDNPTDVTPPANDCIRNGTAYTAKVQQDTNQGYVFDGWYTDEQCTLPYTDGTVLDTDTTLYGKWTVARVCVHYEWVSTDNPSDVAPPADDHIRNGTAYTAKAQQDTHQGYVFDGWYTDEQCTLPYADGTVLDADTTLYGKWTVARVCVHYEWVSTDNPTDVTPPADDHIRNGTAYTAKAQQDTHQGYVFDGWYTDEQCTLPYADGTVLDADTTLYGKWTVARGSLSVSKTVTGNAGDTSKAFNFTVTLGNTEINGVFGEMTFVDGVATFVLKHGESKTATGLPSGITYSVTEAEANQDGYTTVSSKASGSIMKNDTVMVGFTNTKNSNISEGPDHPDVPSKPGTPSTPANLPNTGVTMNLRLWTSVMGASLVGLGISLVVVKKRTRRNRHSN